MMLSRLIVTVVLLTSGVGVMPASAQWRSERRAWNAPLEPQRLDAELLERGGRGDFALGDLAAYPPVTVDRRLHDGETVGVGELMLTAHLTPGHTKGCTTWTTTVREGERQYSVVFVCSLSALPFYRLEGDPAYPGMLADYPQEYPGRPDPRRRDGRPAGGPRGLPSLCRPRGAQARGTMAHAAAGVGSRRILIIELESWEIF